MVQNHIDFVVCFVARVFNCIKYSFGIASPRIALITRVVTRWGQILVFRSTALISGGIFSQPAKVKKVNTPAMSNKIAETAKRFDRDPGDRKLRKPFIIKLFKE